MKNAREYILKYHWKTSLKRNLIPLTLFLGLSFYYFNDYNLLDSLIHGLIIALVTIFTSWFTILHKADRLYTDPHLKKTRFELFNHY